MSNHRQPAAEVADVVPQLPGGGAAGQWASKRRRYIDNLKVLLIAAIIVGHGIGSYTALELWAYADVREATLSAVTEGAALALLAPFGLFMVPLLFLIAGLLTPPSLERKGPRAFVRDRLLRLGVPLAAFALLVWPVLLYALYRPLGNASGSYWSEFVGTAEESLDIGYMWFVADLLIFSLAFAGWAWMRRGRSGRPWRHEIDRARLLFLASAVTIATFLIRLAIPFDSERWVDLNLFQWPSCIALFALGILASRRGWLDEVPARLKRQSGAVMLWAVGGFAILVVLGVGLGGIGEEWAGGWNLTALAFAALESTLAVFGSVWLLGMAQTHLDQRLRWASPAVSRSSYGAFILQGMVLIGLAVALRPLPLPAEVKALIVAGGGVVGSFGLAWLLLSRIPGLARIL